MMYVTSVIAVVGLGVAAVAVVVLCNYLI